MSPSADQIMGNARNANMLEDKFARPIELNWLKVVESKPITI